MMSRTKGVLTDILEVVSSETEVGVSKIMSRSRDAETVDARWICVKLLSEQGYYSTKVAELIGITPRYVQHILTNFKDRASFSIIMRSNYERASKILRKRSETTD